MPRHNFYAPGEYNFVCDNCGLVYKSSEMRRGFGEALDAVVCPKCYTPQHPQDFVYVLPDDQTVPVARDWFPNLYLTEGGGPLGVPYLGEGTLGGP